MPPCQVCEWRAKGTGQEPKLLQAGMEHRWDEQTAKRSPEVVQGKGDDGAESEYAKVVGMVPTGPALSSRSCPWFPSCAAGGGDVPWDTPVTLPASCHCSAPWTMRVCWQPSPYPHGEEHLQAGAITSVQGHLELHVWFGMAMSGALLLLAQTFGLAVAEMALLTMDPPWSMIFQGESVTLRCQGPRVHGQQPTAWYHNGKLLEHTDTNTYRIQNAKNKQNGRYECQCPGSTSSNPVTLSVSYDLLILQVPSHAVFEGEPLHMQCRGWKAGSLAAVRYYRDGADITRLYASAKQLSIPQAKTQHSGRYHCSADMYSYSSLKKRESQRLYVSVKELFTSPVLSIASSAEPLEGSPLNLSCITHLSPYRPHTVLWYLFYGNSTVLQGPMTSSEYQVPIVGLADSGSYSCEVRTESSSIQKWSPQVPITIRRVPISGVSLEVWPQEGRVVEGQRLVLHCSVATGTGSISFSWHREGSEEVLGWDSRYEIPSTQQSDSGQYYCMASNGDSLAQSLRVRVTVVGVSSLLCIHIRAPLLLAALGTLLLGLVAAHVLTAGSKKPKGMKRRLALPVEPSAHASAALQERMFRRHLKPTASSARAPRK
ncbi:Fc receptor-like protein 4 isoform X5 [Numida meleagris]|uniref:Fc receptor-like protein 4 isoform X5 n=3 Tax=Numida meleagris TaxID=8996 RepID=UPI000B3E1395|nr:Fc receptor-like protein 4 isoform X5 [Numida meleagris]